MENELFSAGIEAMRAFEKDRAALRAFADSCMRSHAKVNDKCSQVALIRLAELALQAARSPKPDAVLDKAQSL